MNRETHTIDVSKRSLGRVATEITTLLMGKQRADYRPHDDKGDFVVVKNISNLVLTGDKKKKKIYYRHSGYPGGLKEIPYEKFAKRSQAIALKKAVYGMLPKNKLRKARIKRLKVE